MIEPRKLGEAAFLGYKNEQCGSLGNTDQRVMGIFICWQRSIITTFFLIDESEKSTRTNALGNSNHFILEFFQIEIDRISSYFYCFYGPNVRGLNKYPTSWSNPLDLVLSFFTVKRYEFGKDIRP